MKHVFTVDVEDWFHILDTTEAPPLSEWSTLESRVESNTERLLELLTDADVRATFFILGWVAERYPALIRRIASCGHEVASHGFGHGLIYEMTQSSFAEDLRRASGVIEDACGITPSAYRAPGFSITEQVPWAFDVIRAAGFAWDSSVFPAARAHGGMCESPREPHFLGNGLREFPMTTVRVAGKNIAFLGGGYMRLLPLTVLRQLAALRARGDVPLILYIHPRDIDAQQPRLGLGRFRQFKSYIGLASCFDKLMGLLQAFEWGPLRDCPLPRARANAQHEGS